MDPLAAAKAAASAISSRIRTAPEFDAVLPINDYPQQVRWAVMKRGTIAEISATTKTSITQKGTFDATGRSPPSVKLHLLVEGHSFADVELAMRMLGGLLPGGGMSVPAAGGDGERKILWELDPRTPTFRLVLPGYRCGKCAVEFWTVEDARRHFEADNAAGA